MNKDFLPMTREELSARGCEQPDFVYISGDAYVDHPSFGPALLCRLLEARGYTVGLICQPDWKNPESIQTFGEPRLGFLISSGNMDSMVNHYTVAGKRRSTDAYTPGGKIGKRPDHAVIVYSNLVRRVYRHAAIIIGGIEASLRRMGHYDYWANQVKRSILLDSGADLISYGMGEHSLLEIAEGLAAGISVSDLTYIRGTVFKTRDRSLLDPDGIELPPFEEIKADKKTYARSFYILYCNTDPYAGYQLVECYDGATCVVQNPAALPLTEEEMDELYRLPYTRRWHPSYDKEGGIPAYSEVKFSLVSSRGCFGGCNFCALTFHQGRIIQARSQESLVEEATNFTKEPDFKGYIHDVGGPTADFRHPSCAKQAEHGVCPNRQCLFPKPCPNLNADHTDYIQLLRKLRNIPKVKKVFIRSGIRFDYVLADRKTDFLEELCKYHVSGQLKVAPEHVSDQVLSYMGKPAHEVFMKFSREYAKTNERLGLKQYMVPYLMSSHPGCTLKDAVRLAEYLRDIHYMPEQVQDFYPTPATISTCMYYTGLDPRTMEPVYVPKDPHEKAMQRALMQYRRPQNRALVEEALRKAGRTDLIGFGPECLIRPEHGAEKNAGQSSQNRPKSGRNTREQQMPSAADRKSRTQQQQTRSAESHKKKTIRSVHAKKKK